MNNRFLPPCTYAGHAKPGNRRICRKAKPSILVTLQTCLGCPFAGAFSTSLEPVVTPPLVDETTFPPCVHRGQKLRMDTVKSGCCGAVAVQVNACDVHRECTIKRCLGCPDVLTPAQAKMGLLTGPASLMMFGYLHEKTRDVWMPQFDGIEEQIEAFDGKKVLALACDDSTCEAEIDRSLWDEVIELPNDPASRELIGWRWAMSRLKDEPGFTVRLHAKGAVRGTPEQHLARWWELGFERLLDVDRVRESLQTHIVTGPFRRNVPATNLGVPWHYSGSLYAFRNAEIFGAEWEPVGKVDPGWYVEAWPALVTTHELAGSVGWDGVGDLYQARSWRGVPTEIVPFVARTDIQKYDHAPIVARTDIQKRAVTKSRSVAPPQPTVDPFLPTQVAIIIAGRNNGPFLAEAIESALNQSTPCEVAYADDCSFDDSVEIARRYESRGLKVLPSAVHRGVCDARNRGAAATTAPFLMVLDSDDVLTPDYAETHLAEMRYNTPFVYSAAHYFGEAKGVARCLDWNAAELWRENYVNTSALYARWAFDLAGQWIDTKTAWDWDLALRASRFGLPRRSRAVLHYRRHAASWSHHDMASSRMDEFRLRNSLLSVVGVVTGADKDRFRGWLSSLAQSCRQADIRRELILSDCSQGLPVAAEAAKYAPSFEFIRVIRGTDPARARAEAAGNLVWLAEYGPAANLQDVRACLAKLATGRNPPDSATTGATMITRSTQS